MRPADHLSVAQYAHHAGIGEQAVYQRIRRNQLGDGVIRQGGRYWIHPQRADAAFTARALPCNSRAAQLESRLMAAADEIARDVAGQPLDYCRERLWAWLDQLLCTEPV